MKAQNHIRIGMIDDHKLVLDGLRLLLEEAPDLEVSFALENAKAGFQAIAHHPVHVLLLDIELPDEDGIAFCKKLKSGYPEIRVIALTMYNELSLVRRMIEAGADGYLLKNAGGEELLTAIRRVAEGKSYYSPEIAETLVRGNKPRSTTSPLIPSLSAREKQIVRLLMDEKTTTEIAEQLSISFNTVETHRRNIMSKLNTRNTAGVVRIVLENNLLEDE